MSRGRADYAPSAPPGRGRGGVIAEVVPESPAARAGLTAGDVILAADGNVLRDVLDWQWYSDGVRVRVEVTRCSGPESIELSRSEGEGWGITFSEALFDGVRTCTNRCTFCFMSQLPPDLRRSLYLRDDDYRLSFLQGNFITLTNLTDQDVERICEQRLSPLHISLHAVDPAVRARLVCARSDRATERVDELAEGGVDLHVQIVLVPGVNDGPVLDRTLSWLAEREGVVSVGIVPLGYTRYQRRFSAGYESEEAARAVIEQVRPWQEAMRERDGIAWVYLADEFYLNAGVEVPQAVHYDGYPQYENGIGIARDFADTLNEHGGELSRLCSEAASEDTRFTLLTGMMVAAVLRDALERISGGDCVGVMRVLPVENHFFGGNVAVTGLLAGIDLERAISAERSGSPGIYLLPDVVVNADGQMLDGTTLADLRARTGADVRLVSSDAAGLLEGLRQKG